MILQKMRKQTEDYLGQEVSEAVITVPAYFNDASTSSYERGRRNCRVDSETYYQRADGRKHWLTDWINKIKI